MNIILIGMRGCGKSTISKLLSTKLNMPLIDTDEEIIKKTGKSIPEIIENHGWDFFRSQEKEVVSKVAKLKNHIISTGGGTIIDLDNRKLLKKIGKIIYLYVSPETSIARQLKSTDRPPLTNAESLQEEVKEIYRKRNGVYCESADIIFKRSNNPQKDCEAIVKKTLAL